MPRIERDQILWADDEVLPSSPGDRSVRLKRTIGAGTLAQRDAADVNVLLWRVPDGVDKGGYSREPGGSWIADGIEDTNSRLSDLELYIDGLRAPKITSSAIEDATEDSVYTYVISVTDPDGDTITITAPTKPWWLSITDHGNGTATLTGTPVNTEIGTHSISVVASDGTYSSTQSFVITVDNINDAPTFASYSALHTYEDELYSYTAVVLDQDGSDTITITAPTLPAWMSFTDNADRTATLTGTPANSDVGAHAVVISATDGTATITQSYSLNVDEQPAPPITLASGDAQAYFDFTDQSLMTMAAGDYVLDYADKLGNVANLTQATPSKQGLWKSDEAGIYVAQATQLGQIASMTFDSIICVIRYKDGIDTTFDTYARIFSGAGANDRVQGQISTASLATSAVSTGVSFVNGTTTGTSAVLPMGKSIHRFAFTSLTSIIDVFASSDPTFATRGLHGTAFAFVIPNNGASAAELQKIEGVLAREHDLVLDPSHPYYVAPIIHVPLYGQSLSLGTSGSEDDLIISSVNTSHKMLNGGVRVHYNTPGIETFIPDTAVNPYQMRSFVDLQEQGSPNITRMKETFASGIASKSTKQLLLSTTGRGAYKVSMLDRFAYGGAAAQNNYRNTYATVLESSEIAKANGIPYSVGPIVFKQGEQDGEEGTTKATWKTSVQQLRDDFASDLTLASHTDTSGVKMIVDQQAYSASGKTYADIAVAAIELHRDGTDIVCAGPTYPEEFAGTNNVHMTSNGYRNYGEKLGLVVETINTGGTWNPCHITSVSRSTTTITVNVHVPVAPLAVDTTLISAIANSGFTYDTATITGVTIADDGTGDNTGVITITIDSDVAGVLGYAYRNGTNGLIGATSGSRGNIRDSESSVTINDSKNLHNWLCNDQWEVL